MTGSPWRRRAPTALAVLVAVLLIAGTGALLADANQPTQPCPSGSRTIHPTQLHFEPGLTEHQNWAEISPDEVSLDEILVLCVDGVALGREHMENDDLAAQAVVLRIQTRWVDMKWLSGGLDAYRDPTRWSVVFPPLAEDL